MGARLIRWREVFEKIRHWISHCLELTRLFAFEDFVTFSRCESFKHCTIFTYMQ
jgi:hypothetical protein